MDAHAAVHPTEQTLSSFGLGKLEDASAEAVSKHLEQCPDCRKRVAEMSADSFLGRMKEDFEVIQSFPSDLRWFVHDPDDEAFLLASAREVFAHPKTPASHRQLFLQSCVDRMAG